MPSIDRKWRVILWLGWICLAVGVAGVVAEGVGVWIIWGSAAGAWAHMDWSSAWPFVLFGAVLGWVAISEGRKGRERQRLRALALAGDTAAMPPAAFKPLASEPAEASGDGASIAALRPVDRGPWNGAGVLLLFALLITAGILLVMILSQAPELALTICGAVLALAVALSIWWWVRRPAGESGVIATERGLRWIVANRERAMIPWSEARLFEVFRMRSDAANPMGFALTDGRTLIEWANVSLHQTRRSAASASPEEMMRRNLRVATRVIARTGLTPRTLAPDLAAPLDGSPTGAARARMSPLGAAIVLLLAGLPLVSGVGALLAPLTKSLALNLIVAITLGIPGAALEGAALWSIIQELRGREAALAQPPEIALPPAPPDDSWPLTLASTALSVWRDRGIGVILLALTALDGYALVRGVIDFSGSFGDGPWDLHRLTVSAMFLPVLILGMLGVYAALEKRTRVIADESDMRFLRGREKIVIPWDLVAEMVIKVESKNGKVASFWVVARDAQRTEMGWPADARWQGRPPLPSGAPPAEVFAAAVARRAGVTPRVARPGLDD